MIRRPIVAGMFYPLHRDNLSMQLSKLFRDVRKGDFIGVISPHAGYEYSGRTAAYAINSLKPASSFVILGPNHNLIGNEFSVMESGEWETPLGRVEIESNLAKELKKCGILEEDDLSHAQEHSIEVQLPFLQYRFRKFKFVPISISNVGYSKDFLERCEKIGKHIAKTIKNKPIGVIASSDFSHYLPANVAKEKDEKAIDKINKLDAVGFFRKLEEIDASVCGYAPIAVLMYIAKELGLKAKIINRTDSGETTGDRSAVVSYYAIGFR